MVVSNVEKMQGAKTTHKSNLADKLGEAIESGKDRLRDFGSITHKILLNFTQQTGPTEQTQ